VSEYCFAACVGTDSQLAGKAAGCEGCPNQEACATAPKGPDPGELAFESTGHYTTKATLWAHACRPLYHDGNLSNKSACRRSDCHSREDAAYSSQNTRPVGKRRRRQVYLFGTARLCSGSDRGSGKSIEALTPEYRFKPLAAALIKRTETSSIFDHTVHSLTYLKPNGDPDVDKAASVMYSSRSRRQLSICVSVVMPDEHTSILMFKP
jgi:hypothetical protein